MKPGKTVKAYCYRKQGLERGLRSVPKEADMVLSYTTFLISCDCRGGEHTGRQNLQKDITSK